MRDVLERLEEAKSGFRWKKVEHGYQGGMRSHRIWRHELQSAKHTWVVKPTGEDPVLGFAHKKRRTNYQVFKDGKKFGEPRPSVAKAKKVVEDWIRSYEGTEHDA